MRILDAAHHAPSVGFMQPWNFILVRDRQIRAQVSAAFAHGVEAEEKVIEPERRDLYRSLKLEGILRAPLNICVTCDRARAGPTGPVSYTHLCHGQATITRVASLIPKSAPGEKFWKKASLNFLFSSAARGLGSIALREQPAGAFTRVTGFCFSKPKETK